MLDVLAIFSNGYPKLDVGSSVATIIGIERYLNTGSGYCSI